MGNDQRHQIRKSNASKNSGNNWGCAEHSSNASVFWSNGSGRERLREIVINVALNTVVEDVKFLSKAIFNLNKTENFLVYKKWLNFDCILTALNCILVEFRLNFGCLLAEFWPKFDWILTEFWLHFGCILAAFWLNFDGIFTIIVVFKNYLGQYIIAKLE